MTVRERECVCARGCELSPHAVICCAWLDRAWSLNLDTCVVAGTVVPMQETLAPQKLYDVVHRQQPTSFKHARDDSQVMLLLHARASARACP